LCGPNVTKKLAVHAPDRLPMVNVGEIRPGADHVRKLGACIAQSLRDDLKASSSLRGGIAFGARLAT
jgi:hypothetical protein